MKKLITFLVIFVMMATAAFAGSVSRNMASRLHPGEELTVTLSISGATAGKLFTLEDVIPQGLTIKEWMVSGTQETKDQINVRQKENRFGWSFTPTSASASVEYKIDLSDSDAAYTFGPIVWFDPSGQGTESSTPTLTVAAITCGDGICEGSENSDNCVQDCPLPPPPAPAPAPPVVEEKKGLSTTAMAWIVVFVIVVLGAVGYYMWQKKRQKPY